MQPNPLINPYNQTTAALMQGLLAETRTRFAIDAARLSYHHTSVPDAQQPAKAIAYYTDHKRPDLEQGIPMPYRRLDIDRYVGLYPTWLRYLPWSDDTFTVEDLLTYVSQNLGVLLMSEDVDVDIAETEDATGARSVVITPHPIHPIWYGQLALWVVAATDLRYLITQYNYAQFDPTELPC